MAIAGCGARRSRLTSRFTAREARQGRRRPRLSAAGGGSFGDEYGSSIGAGQMAPRGHRPRLVRWSRDPRLDGFRPSAVSGSANLPPVKSIPDDRADDAHPGRPGAVLHYDIRTSESTTEPPLPLFGSPMPAGGFVILASHFTDHMVVTYAPRSCQRRRRAQDWILDFGRTPNHCHYRSASRRRESRCQRTGSVGVALSDQWGHRR